MRGKGWWVDGPFHARKILHYFELYFLLTDSWPSADAGAEYLPMDSTWYGRALVGLSLIRLRLTQQKDDGGPSWRIFFPRTLSSGYCRDGLRFYPYAGCGE